MILFCGRSGSSHIVSSLNSHPHVVTYGEMFHGKPVDRQDSLMEALLAGVPMETLDHEALPERYRHDHTGVNERIDAVGLKTKPGDVADLDRFSALLREHRFKVVAARFTGTPYERLLRGSG